MIKKMAIQREGVDRENWMWTAASKVQEWNEEWTKARKERLKVCGGVLAADPNGVEAMGGEGPERKRRKVVNDLPLGVYEPHSGIVHCEFLFYSSSDLLIYCDVVRSGGYAAYAKSMGACSESRQGEKRCAGWDKSGSRCLGTGLGRHDHGVLTGRGGAGTQRRNDEGERTQVGLKVFHPK
jgi:hypothetical protein